ncbi:MAG: hypothetical protein ACP5OA_03810 [Candidatus Woesearchaeota archaeon]
MEQDTENLEKKITFWDRAKYASIPAALTVGAMFIPNMKRKYERLPENKREAYETVALAGTAILGTAAALFSGYRLAMGKDENVPYRG